MTRVMGILAIHDPLQASAIKYCRVFYNFRGEFGANRKQKKAIWIIVGKIGMDVTILNKSPGKVIVTHKYIKTTSIELIIIRPACPDRVTEHRAKCVGAH